MAEVLNLTIDFQPENDALVRRFLAHVPKVVGFGRIFAGRKESGAGGYETFSEQEERTRRMGTRIRRMEQICTDF